LEIIASSLEWDATISAADHQAQAADLTVRLLRTVEGE
jgi:hypothetical protein